MTTPNDATQDLGVPANPTAEDTAKEREPTERELLMESIAQQVDRREGQAEPEPQPEPDQISRQMSAELEDEQLGKLVKTKIDGVEAMVSVEEMRRQYQKAGAAERRLEEATRLLNEARRQNPTKEVDVTPASADSAGTQPRAPAEGDEGKEFLAALFDGDETKALAALQKLGLGRQQPTYDPAQLAAQLTPAIKQQLTVDSALEQFKADYAEIVADPYLANLADGFLDAELKNGKPFQEAIEAAGKQTRDWLGSKGVVQAGPTPTIGRNTKLERKAGMDRIPALNTKAVNVEEPEMSASDVINEMRKARGLSL